jgi:hypothetical protein
MKPRSTLTRTQSRFDSAVCDTKHTPSSSALLTVLMLTPLPPTMLGTELRRLVSTLVAVGVLAPALAPMSYAQRPPLCATGYLTPSSSLLAPPVFDAPRGTPLPTLATSRMYTSGTTAMPDTERSVHATTSVVGTPNDTTGRTPSVGDTEPRASLTAFLAPRVLASAPTTVSDTQLDARAREAVAAVEEAALVLRHQQQHVAAGIKRDVATSEWPEL